MTYPAAKEIAPALTAASGTSMKLYMKGYPRGITEQIVTHTLRLPSIESVQLLPQIHDFHTHSFLSDGVLSPIELIRRAVAAGYATIAVTDHVGPGNVELVIEQLIPECAAASKHWPILAIPGVEITHVPAATVADIARRARRAGAQ